MVAWLNAHSLDGFPGHIQYDCCQFQKLVGSWNLDNTTCRVALGR